MPSGKAGSTPTRRSTRATKGQTPTRYGMKAADEKEEAPKQAVVEALTPSKRPLRRGSTVKGGYVVDKTGEYETIDTDDEEDEVADGAGDEVDAASLAAPAASKSWSPGGKDQYSYAMIFAPTYFTVAFAYLIFSYGEAESSLGFYTEATLKAGPILVLLLGLLLADSPTCNPFVMGGALVFSAIGDVVLHIEQDAAQAAKLKGTFVGDNAFNLGIAAFAIAQLCYATALFKKPAFDNARVAAAAAFLVCLYLASTAVVAGAVAKNEAEDTITMIKGYIGIISIMVFSAIAGTEHRFEATLGAICFVFSDMCIGLNRFGELRGFGGAAVDADSAAMLIMVTYYIAQWSLFRGLE